MKPRDLVVGGGEAWEIIKVDGRQAHVRLLAGAGVEARTSDIPSSILSGRAVYRRVSVLEDVDVKLAAVEVSRYVPVDALKWYPRSWVEEFLKRFPVDSPVPDSTTLLGWFARMIDAGEARLKAERSERYAERKLSAKKPIIPEKRSKRAAVPPAARPRRRSKENAK